MQKSSIKIVLVNPKHPGNIGATARAMKTMGLSRLYLVDPLCFPSDEATARAVGAHDILDGAQVVDTLKEAIFDCALIVGMSARKRHHSLTVYHPEESMQQVYEESHLHPVAILFGREDRGLTNEELSLCHHQVFIPASPEFCSLNLAASVQIVAYELRKASMMNFAQNKNTMINSITTENMEKFYEHLYTVLLDIGFLKNDNHQHMMRKLRKIYNRIRLTEEEFNILRGILTKIQRK